MSKIISFTAIAIAFALPAVVASPSLAVTNVTAKVKKVKVVAKEAQKRSKTLKDGS